MDRTGEVRKLSLIKGGSATKTAVGGESFGPLIVCHGEPAPLQEESHPGGRAEGSTSSKFSDNTKRGLPNGNAKLAVPKLLVPSCSCSVATLLWPQAPLAVKEKGQVKVPP